MSKPIELVICGAGSRGLEIYADYARRYPDRARVVAVAEPQPSRRELARQRLGLSRDQLFGDWREVLAQPRLGQAAVVATQDQHHTEPAIALMRAGYDVLLEKPMATNEEDCRRIVEASEASGQLLAVCHVLRYSPYFCELKRFIESGALGELASIRHFEPVNFWHFAHSFVRGNWRRSDQSSPFILAKCCHDMDIMLYLLGRSCTRLTSFGRLAHFRSQCRPAEATDRCLDCPVSQCPYSASRFYFGELERGNLGWPLDVITEDFSHSGVEKALREGPYGRCVYDCDNDVVDHQVVCLEFEGGVTATFTAAAFTDHRERETEVMGSHGCLRGDGRWLTYDDFTTRQQKRWEVKFEGHHLGGDDAMMNEFVAAVQERNPSRIRTGARVSLESHLLAFAAERSRLNGTVERF
ncbi:MAG: Gfo/Idh/MocA family protein [Vulcanimicrobiota bacterium]